jgi:hypothetical protein
MALRAVEDFAGQTYAARELIVAILGDDGKLAGDLLAKAAALTAAGQSAHVRIVKVGKADTCGGARAVALAASTADACMTWDDDDRQHPRRLEVQASCLGGMSGVALADILVLDRPAGKVTWVDAGIGPSNGAGGLLPSTLLYRRGKGLTYKAGGPATDVELFVAVGKQGAIAPVAGRPHLLVKMIHGSNATDPDQLRRWSLRRAVESGLYRREQARVARGLADFDWSGRKIALVDPRDRNS